MEVNLSSLSQWAGTKIFSILPIYQLSIGTPFAMTMFAWTKLEAVWFISAANIIMNAISLISYLVFIVFRLERM